MNQRRLVLWGGGLFVITMLLMFFLGQEPEQLSAWWSESNQESEPVTAHPPPPPPKRSGPCLGMTWKLLSQKDFVAQVGPDAASNWLEGDTSCDAVLSVLCFKAGELGVTSPVPGRLLASVALADSLCASRLGAGWRMLELRDGPSGAQGKGELPGNARFWVANQAAAANPWN